MRCFLVFFGLFHFYAMPVHAQKELSKEDLKVGRLLQKETPKLEKCYRSFVKTHLNAEGEIVVNFTISEGGRAKNVGIEEGTFASAKFSKCVTKVIANLRFFEHLKKELKQKRTFVFAKKQNTPFTKEGLSTLISLEKSVGRAREISRRMNARTNEIAQCYETFLKRKPTVENGKVVISFTIGEDGEAKNSQPIESTFAHPDIGVCVAKIIGNIAFSRPTGKPFLVKKTFVFEHADRHVGNIKRLEHMKKWLRPHQSAVNQCILQNSKKAIPDDGKLVGRLYLKDKKLRFIKKVWSTFEPTVDACIISEIKKWNGSLELEGIGPMSLPFEFVE